MPDGVHERSSLLPVWKHACIKKAAGMVQGDNGDLGFAEWNRRTGQNHPKRWHCGAVVFQRILLLTGAILMTLHSTVSNPYEEDLSEALLLDPQSQPRALRRRRAGNQDDARVIKWMWENVKRGFRGGVRSFEG